MRNHFMIFIHISCDFCAVEEQRFLPRPMLHIFAYIFCFCYALAMVNLHFFLLCSSRYSSMLCSIYQIAICNNMKWCQPNGICILGEQNVQRTCVMYSNDVQMRFECDYFLSFSSCFSQKKAKQKNECERNPMKYRMLDEKFHSRFSLFNDTIYTMERYYILFDSSKRTCHLRIFAYKTPKLTIIENFLWSSHSQLPVLLSLSLLLAQTCFNWSGGAYACILSCLCPNQNKHRVNNILRHSIHVHSKSF